MPIVRALVNLLLVALFFLTELKNLSWLNWFTVFVVSDLTDTASTFAFLYKDHWDCDAEGNPCIRYLGAKIGVILAVCVHTFAVITAVFFVSFLLNIVSQMFAAFVLMWISAVKFDAAIHNFVYAAIGRQTPGLVINWDSFYD